MAELPESAAPSLPPLATASRTPMPPQTPATGSPGPRALRSTVVASNAYRVQASGGQVQVAPGSPNTAPTTIASTSSTATTTRKSSRSSYSRNGERDYKAVRVIGEGSFGSVALAVKTSALPRFLRHTSDDQPVLARDTTDALRARSPSVIGPSGLSAAFLKSRSNSAGEISLYGSGRPQGAPRPDDRFLEQFSTDNALALKVIAKSRMTEANADDRTANELRVLERCAHPFIVKFCFALETPQNIFIATEYCPGGELFSLLQKNDRLFPHEVRFYACEIALALGHLHRNDILYRDLKPENITLAADGHVRLIDFGLAVLLEHEADVNPETGRREVITHSGTLVYSAPEVLRRVPHSFETDWWSLGVVIFEMAFGYLPWFDDDTAEVCRLICCEPVQPPADLRPEEFALFDLVTKLLDKDGAARLGSQSDVASHHFFANIDWDSVLGYKLSPPWVPHLHHVLDVANFDDEFTQTRVDAVLDEPYIGRGVGRVVALPLAPDLRQRLPASSSGGPVAQGQQQFRPTQMQVNHVAAS